MLRREYIDVTISMARLGGPFFGQKFKVFKEKLMVDINVAIIGVGNCASSLVQGVSKYSSASNTDSIPGLMHPVLG